MTAITVDYIDESFLNVKADENWLAYEIRDHFSFMAPNAHWDKRVKRGLWDGKIKLYDVRTEKFPRGLFPNLQEFCREKNYELKVNDLSIGVKTNLSIEEAKSFIANLNLPDNIQPRDYQIKAFIKAIRHNRRLLISPTGSGKSLIIYMLIRYYLDVLKLNFGAIIVPKTSLVEQMYGDFKEYSSKNNWNIEKYCSRIYHGQDKSIKPVFITTWQTLHANSQHLLPLFQYVIGDEGHHLSAKSLSSLFNAMTKCKYRIGTTGTLDGTQIHKLVIEGLVGKIYRVATTDELIQNKTLSDIEIKCIILQHNYTDKKMDYESEIQYLISNEKRNNYIVNLALSLEFPTLILFRFIEGHGDLLHRLLTEKNTENKKIIHYIHGKIKVDERESARISANENSNTIILASTGTFQEGVNIPNLTNLILASPQKGLIMNKQSIGRGLRRNETKTLLSVFDISDDLRKNSNEKLNYSLSHFTERMGIYKSEKFPTKIYNIELNPKTQ